MQNGGFAYAQRSVERERLYIQSGPEKYSFLSLLRPGPSKHYPILMGKTRSYYKSICMFWVLPSFKNHYKTFKISAAILHGININNLHRQFIVAESDCKGSGRWSKIH